MRSAALLASVAFLTLARSAIATTLFAGNFVVLSAEREMVDVGVNYPRLGAGEICGIEIKTRPIVLHARVWQSLADALRVTEVDENGAETAVAPVIASDYSPRIYYRFTDLRTDYGRIRLRSAVPGQSVAEAIQRVFSTYRVGAEAPLAIAVAASCP